ncbi:4-hydroxybenzoyl-CoA reductase subunit alpha [Geodia barretti]|uniref:4-hydroxybenzoyl-CoA reductase subunit alpha n=1 Tax=Geodia barretti TaxID=519541 RepID=A0AA35SLH6_GEOBA|nr:4-hydroxybenzoyl-CoA reductase subunit alpha [Geodia barretti]
MASNVVLSTKEFNVVGTRPIRHDGYDKVTGKALYGADMNLPGMLHGQVLRSPHAHANILSLDTSKAEAHPGVLAVVTSADFAEAPDEARVIVAGPPTNLKHLSNNVLAGGKALYKGHAIAAVAAQSVHAAEEALALIDVEYEVLPSVATVEEAIADGAPQLHENYKGNIASHSEMTLGDIEKGFAEADIVVEKQAQESSDEYLQGTAAIIEEGRQIRVQWGTLDGGPASKIVEYAEAQQNSLIAMCTQGRTGLGRWVLGSVTDAVIRAGNTPVLVMPHGEDG